MAIYGYARCSTEESRQDIERQVRELKARGAQQIFKEYASGADTSRPELAKLFSTLKKGDTLLVAEISRLTRSLPHLVLLVQEAKKIAIRLSCGFLELDYTSGHIDPMKQTMFYMMGVFAELERGLTVERIKSGIANAKSKGTPMGRPRKNAQDVPGRVKTLLPDLKAGKISKAEFAKATGISRPTLYKYLRLLESD